MAEPQKSQEPTMEEILASIRRIISDDDEASAEAADDASAPVSDSDAEEAAVDADMSEMMADAVVEEVALQADAEDSPAEVEADASEEVDFDAISVAEEAEPQAEPQAEAEPEGEAAAEDVFELTEVLVEETPEELDEVEAIVERDEIDFADIETETETETVAEEPGLEAELVAAFEPDPAPQAVPNPAGIANPAAGLMSKDAQATASAAFGALASTMLSHSGGARTLEGIVEDLLRPLLKAWLDENLPPLVERLVREEIERVARRSG